MSWTRNTEDWGTDGMGEFMDTLLAYMLVGTFIVIVLTKYFGVIIQLFVELLKGLGLLK